MGKAADQGADRKERKKGRKKGGGCGNHRRTRKEMAKCT
jgi:hypothetical protein